MRPRRWSVGQRRRLARASGSRFRSRREAGRGRWLPQAGQVTVIGGERVAHIVVGQAFLGGDESFVAVEGAVYVREVGETFLHGCGEFGLEVDDIRDDAAETFFVEFERLGNVIEDTEIIHDETVRLFIAVGAVGSRNGLQQGVIAHGLVETHGLQDRRLQRIEPQDATMLSHQIATSIKALFPEALRLEGLRLLKYQDDPEVVIAL